ncbi:MAG: glycosyltransferase family 39 protein, partial [Chthoniobacterales bacterium]
IEIRQPFVDNWSWRQSDVASIARNFQENGFHLARPQIDWAGSARGFVGTEFPILPFVAAVCYKFTGTHEWIGRIQGLIFFAAALPFFFLLVRDVLGEMSAIWATFFYAFAPLSVVASRAFMPDIPSLSLALAGIYFFARWTERTELPSLIASAVLVSAAFLIKLPTAVVGAPLLYLSWRRFGWNFPRRPELWLFAGITILPAVAWYWHAHQIAERFYPYHFFGGGGFRIMNASWYLEIAKQTVVSTLTPVLFALAAIGAFLPRRRRCGRLFDWWFAAMMVFIFLVGWGNRHQWYQLPLVPIAAAFAGASCACVADKLKGRRAISASLAAALVVLFAGTSYLCARPFYAPIAAGLRQLGYRLQTITPPDSLIVATDNGDPTIFYYARRKGWHFTEAEGIYNGEPADSAQAIANLERLRRRGADYLVFTSGTRWWLDYYTEFAEHLARSATVVDATPGFVIYRLNPHSK